MSAKFFRTRFVVISLVIACLLTSVFFRSSLRSLANSAVLVGNADADSGDVPIIGATKSVAVVVGNADADADPGETLEYTVTISNTGPDPATGVTINDTIQSITTLVAGSTVASPIAVNDTFSSIGNVGISVPAANGVFLNDLNPNGSGTLVVQSINSAGLQGILSLNTTDGSFQFTPNPGFEGSTSFTYTLANGTGLTDTATVSITVSGMIWFINANAGVNGDGRLGAPFNSLANFNAGAADDPNDNIFLFESATGYSGGVTLLAGQKIIGQDATATLASITGVTVPPFSSPALPAMNTGGNATTLITGGVNVSGGGNTVRGMTISNTSTAKITGTNFGTLTVGNNVSPDVIVSGTGKAIDLNNGSFAATSAFTSVATTSSTSHGMQLISVGGTVSFGSTSVSGSASQGIFVNASNVNLNFGNTTVGATTAGEGVRLENNTGGTRTFGTLSITNSAVQGLTDSGGGNTTVTGLATITNPANVGILVSGKTAGTSVTFANVSNTQSGSHGVQLTSNAGTVTFGDLDITADANQRAFLATNNTGTITTTSGTFANTGTAVAVEITNAAGTVPLNMTLTGVSSTGASSGMILTNTSGSFTVTGTGSAGSGGTIQSSTGNGITLNNVQSVSFSRMNIQSSGDDGINGTTVNGFTLADSSIINNGNSTTDEGIEFNNLLGTSSITNATVTGNAHNNFKLDNNNTNLTSLTVTGGSFSSTGAFGNHGFLFEARGTSIVSAVSVSSTTIQNNFSIGMQVTTADTATISSFIVSGCTFTDTGTGNSQEIAADFATAQMSNMTYKFLNNTITNMNSHGFNTFTAAGAGTGGTLNGTIDGNTIGNQAVIDSGSKIGNGMRININGGANARIKVNNNTLRQIPTGRGIESIARNGTGGANFIITNNTIVAPTATNQIGCGPNVLCPLAPIHVQTNTVTVANNACSVVSGNTAYDPLIFPAGGESSVQLIETSTSQLTYEGNIAQTALQNLTAANPAAVTKSVSGAVTVVAAGTCAQPPPIAPPADEEPVNIIYGFDTKLNFVNTAYQSPFENGEFLSNADFGTRNAEFDPKSKIQNPKSEGTFVYTHVSSLIDKLGEMISPTAYAQETKPTVPESGETVTKSLGTLPAGKSIVVKFRTTVDNGPYASGVNNITNTATISGSNFANVNSTTSSIALDAAPDLVVTKTEGGGTTQPGVTLVYTLSYSNATATNGQNAANAVLTETVPTNTTFNATASLPSVWSCADGSAAGTNCTINIGNLNDNASGSATFAVNVLAALPAGATQVSNTSSIAENPNVNGTDRNVINNSGPDTTNIIGNWLGGTSTDWFTAANWSNGVVPPAGNNVSIPNVANQPIVTTADVTLNNMNLIGENVTINASRTVTVNGVTTLGANNINGAGTLNLGAAATITRTTGQVECTLNKNFAAIGLFTFPVGTTGAFSPVDVNVTAGTGQLSVKANTGTAPLAPIPLNAARTLQRYWTLSGSGITSNITFNYLNGDVPGLPNNENIWNVIRVVGGTSAVRYPPGPNVILNAAANTFTLNGIQVYSDWTAGEPLAPTASNAAVSGQVLDNNGRGVAGSRVSITDSNGNVRHAITNPFGYYSFVEIVVGQSYVISVSDKRYQYSSRVVNVSNDVNGVDFIPLN